MKEPRCYRAGVLMAALVIGLAITWVDTRPSWDDAGITAGLIVMATVILGALLPRQAWISALAVGVWIPVVGVIRHGNCGTGLALVFAFVGAYAGAFGKRLLMRETA